MNTIPTFSSHKMKNTFSEKYIFDARLFLYLFINCFTNCFLIISFLLFCSSKPPSFSPQILVFIASLFYDGVSFITLNLKIFPLVLFFRIVLSYLLIHIQLFNFCFFTQDYLCYLTLYLSLPSIIIWIFSNLNLAYRLSADLYLKVCTLSFSHGNKFSFHVFYTTRIRMLKSVMTFQFNILIMK